MSKRSNFDIQDNLDDALCSCGHSSFEHAFVTKRCTIEGCNCKRFTTFKNDGIDLGHGHGAVCATKEALAK